MGVAEAEPNQQSVPTLSAIAEPNQRSTPTLPVNNDFENAARRFLFTISNRTSYKFVLCGSRKECGILDAPNKELDAGTRSHPAELCIRGYKKDYALYGVTYTLQFRILDATDQVTNRRLNVFLGVGIATNNYFGWYICTDQDQALSSTKWKSSLHSSNGYNREKTSYGDRVLNEGGKYHLRASFDELRLDIEMLTDNEAHSTPTMIIK